MNRSEAFDENDNRPFTKQYRHFPIVLAISPTVIARQSERLPNISQIVKGMTSIS